MNYSQRDLIVPEAALAVLEHRHNIAFGSAGSAVAQIGYLPNDAGMLERARRVMGDHVAALSDEDLAKHLVHYQELIDMWLDEFECQQFNGSTLNQLL